MDEACCVMLRLFVSEAMNSPDMLSPGVVVDINDIFLGTGTMSTREVDKLQCDPLSLANLCLLPAHHRDT